MIRSSRPSPISPAPAAPSSPYPPATPARSLDVAVAAPLRRLPTRIPRRRPRLRPLACAFSGSLAYCTAARPAVGGVDGATSSPLDRARAAVAVAGSRCSAIFLFLESFAPSQVPPRLQVFLRLDVSLLPTLRGGACDVHQHTHELTERIMRGISK